MHNWTILPEWRLGLKHMVQIKLRNGAPLSALRRHEPGGESEHAIPCTYEQNCAPLIGSNTRVRKCGTTRRVHVKKRL
jgi:hypothetical protein